MKERLEKYHNKILEIGSRASGSWKELETAAQFKSILESFGLKTKLESFTAASHMADRSVVSDSAGKIFPSLPNMFSVEGEKNGELVFIGDCRTSMVDKNVDLSGKIGILNPSGAELQERIVCVLDLEKRGLEALIIVSPSMDSINTKIIRFPELKRMPTVSVSWRTAHELKKIEGEYISLSVFHSGQKRNESVNLVGVIEGTGDNWLVVSAHMDTAPFTVGANDNASGCALLLELARQLAEEPNPEATIYILFSGSEENGGTDMCGSGANAFYSNRMNVLQNCIAHVEIDDVGNALSPFEILVGGNKKFRDMVAGQESDINYGVIEDYVPWCDHGAAIKNGIPYLCVKNSSGPRPIYHTPEDNIEFFDIDMLAGIFPFVKNSVKALSSCSPFFPFLRKEEMLIRPARFSDIDAIQQITRLAFEPVSKDRMAEDFFGLKLGGKNWFEYKNAGLEKQCKQNIYLVIVCEVQDKVVGYATMSLDFHRGIAEIENNAVHPDFQGKGIGKAMQKEIKRRMIEDGFSMFTVTTLSNDLAAQRVYEKLGYIKYSESYHYFKKGVYQGE